MDVRKIAEQIVSSAIPEMYQANQDVVDELYVLAVNDAEGYRKKDSGLAVKNAQKEYLDAVITGIKEDVAEAGSIVEKEVLKYWKEEGHI